MAVLMWTAVAIVTKFKVQINYATKYHAGADEALKFAKERLEKFAHVGVVDDLHAGLEVAAATLGLPLDGTAYAPGELFVPGLKKLRMMTWQGGMKPGQGDSTAVEVEVPHHGATTVEELEELIVKQEAEAQRLYDIAYDQFMVSCLKIRRGLLVNFHLWALLAGWVALSVLLA